MAHETGAPSGAAQAVRSRPCPDNEAEHVILELSEEEARLVGVSDSRTLHADRTRQPQNGDLVWVELVRRGSTQRMVRRYALESGWVTLSAPGGGTAAIMRRRGELLVLGVVTDSVSCDDAMAQTGGS